MKLSVNTHKPDSTLWLVAMILFIWGVLPLPLSAIALILSAALLLLGTTLI